MAVQVPHRCVEAPGGVVEERRGFKQKNEFKFFYRSTLKYNFDTGKKNSLVSAKKAGHWASAVSYTSRVSRMLHETRLHTVLATTASGAMPLLQNTEYSVRQRYGPGSTVMACTVISNLLLNVRKVSCGMFTRSS